MGWGALGYCSNLTAFGARGGVARDVTHIAEKKNEMERNREKWFIQRKGIYF